MQVEKLPSRWIEILASLVADWQALRQAHNSIVVARDDGGLVMRRARDARGAIFATLAPGAKLPAETAQAMRKRLVVFELAADKVVTRQLKVPAKAQEFLAGIVRNQIDRLSPWPPAQALFCLDARPAANDPGNLDVRVYIAARANIEAWSSEKGLDAIVINASGCGTTVKDYGFMFRSEPEPWREQATKIAGLTLDITEFLSRFGYAPTREAPGLTVAYHSACSLQHGQQVTAEPKALLSRAGFRVVEPREAHICCGSAGTYNLLQPEIAGRLRERKLGNLKATKPDLIAAGNIGCITQLSGDAVPVVHTVELLDWMAGGPKPPGVPG